MFVQASLLFPFGQSVCKNFKLVAQQQWNIKQDK